MHDEPDVYIDRGTSALIPKSSDGETDPISGNSVIMRDYAKQNPIVLEQEISKPKDYCVNVFSTFNELLYTQHQNNLITPITYRANADLRGINKYMDTQKGKGVFVVERYNIVSILKRNLPDFLDYYEETRGIAYNEETIERIRALIAGSVTNKNRFSSVEIRILTFIPEHRIREHQFTYVTGPGVVIVHGDVPPNLLHPYSPAYLEETLLNPVKDDGSTSIDITIIDNDNKPYYFMLGSDVKTIRPLRVKQNNVLPLGGTIVTSRKGFVVDEKFIKLEEFEASGLYRSSELCKTNGNRALMIEELKINNDLERAKLELDKIKESNEKLKLEAIARKEQYDLDMEKKRAELFYYKASKNLEYAHICNKYTIDNKSSMLTLRTNAAKLKADIHKSISDVEKAEQLHKIKVAEHVPKLLELFFKILI